MLVAHLAAAGGFLLAVGGALSLDQAGIGEEVLDAREAVNGADLVDQRQRQDSADAGDGLEEVECGSVVDLDLFGQEDLQFGDRPLECLHDGHVGGDGHLDVLVVGKVLEEFVAVARLVDALLEGFEVVLSVGVLDMTEQFGSLAGEEEAPTQQISGRSHVAWVDVGDGEIAAARSEAIL